MKGGPPPLRIVPTPSPLTHQSVPVTECEFVTDCEVIWIPMPVKYTCWPWYDVKAGAPEVRVYTEDGTHIGYVLRSDL